MFYWLSTSATASDVHVLYLCHERAKSILRSERQKGEAMQTFLFSGNSKSAYMKGQTGKITKPKTRASLMCLPQLWAVCSFSMFLFNFPPQGQERETPE